MKTILRKTMELLDRLRIKYKTIKYDYIEEIRLEKESGLLKINGFCDADIQFDENGRIKQINIWGD